MKKHRRLRSFLYAAVSAVLVITAVCCTAVRLPDYAGSDSAAVMAAALTISKGGNTAPKTAKAADAAEKKAEKATKPPETKPTASDFSEDYYNTFAKHPGAVKYPVYENNLSNDGIRFGNFFVKNNTDFNLNIGYSLSQKLGFRLEKTDDVQVLIYHTHTSESYLDCDVGYYYSDYYPRSSDNRYNVTRVGEEIAKSLRAEGIGVVHDTTLHDSTYTGSYYRSRDTVDEYLKKYPKIKVTLDIHRDSIGSDEYKVKPTFTYKGKKAAQIMIMAGYDPDGELEFPDWSYNLRFALRLQQMCENKYSGMTRPLDFGWFVYNMDVNTGSLLIEVGTDSNTLDEAMYSGKLLGKALAQVLQNNT